MPQVLRGSAASVTRACRTCRRCDDASLPDRLPSGVDAAALRQRRRSHRHGRYVVGRSWRDFDDRCAAGPSTRNRCVPLAPFHAITESFPAWAAAATIAASDGGSVRPSPPLNGANRPSALSVAAEIQPIARARQRHVQQALAFFRFARLEIAIGIALVLADRHRRLHVRRRGQTAPAPHESHRATPPLPRCMLTTNTTGNSSPLAACVVIRLTASMASTIAFDSSPPATSSREVIDDAAERGVAAILNPPDERADLLQVLACLPVRPGRRSPRRTPTRPARDRAALTAAADRPAPARTRHVGARERQTPLIVGADELRRSPPAASASMSAADEPRRQPLERLVRQPDEPRAQKRRRVQLRLRPGEERQQREHVLDLVGVEEARGPCRRRTARVAGRARPRTADGPRACETGWRCRPAGWRRRTPVSRSRTVAPLASSAAISSATVSACCSSDAAATRPSASTARSPRPSSAETRRRRHSGTRQAGPAPCRSPRRRR